MSYIPDSKAQDSGFHEITFLDSGLHEQNCSGFRNTDSLHGATQWNEAWVENFVQSVYLSPQAMIWFWNVGTNYISVKFITFFKLGIHRIHKWRTRGKKLVPSHESEALEDKQKLQMKTFSELAEC